MKSFPFDSQITGTDSETGLPLMDRAQSAETLQKFFENLFQDGIFQNYENCCQVSPGSGMNVLVNVGGGCCGGSIFVEENIRTLALQAAHESLDRIDAIVVRKNNNINYRSTDLYVVTGNPAEIPVAPEPTRSSSIHEIVLAHVFVARGTTSIPSYRITDTRLDSSVCGIATPMQEVDTSGIFEQYQAALDEYLETVASAIDNTLAGNLQNQITALSNNQADAFSKTSTYSVGDYCIYQNVLKKCIKDVETAGDYDSTCWEDTTIGEEFSELNRKFVFNRQDESEAGICTPHYIVIIGTIVLKGANADYRQLFSASELLSKLKFYDPSISNFEPTKCVVTTNNGDGNAATIHFYAPEWWGSNNAYFQYFYPSTSATIRVNYCIHYINYS